MDTQDQIEPVQTSIFEEYMNVQLMSENDYNSEAHPEPLPDTNRLKNLSKVEAENMLLKVYKALKNLDDAENFAVVAEGKAMVLEHNEAEKSATVAAPLMSRFSKPLKSPRKIKSRNTDSSLSSGRSKHNDSPYRFNPKLDNLPIEE